VCIKERGREGERVLVCSHSNAAVDHLATRLLEGE